MRAAHRAAATGRVVAGIGDPGRGESLTVAGTGDPGRAFGSGIDDAGYRCRLQGFGYNISDSSSPCYDHSSALATKPARTGFCQT